MKSKKSTESLKTKPRGSNSYIISCSLISRVVILMGWKMWTAGYTIVLSSLYVVKRVKLLNDNVLVFVRITVHGMCVVNNNHTYADPHVFINVWNKLLRNRLDNQTLTFLNEERRFDIQYWMAAAYSK